MARPSLQGRAYASVVLLLAGDSIILQRALVNAVSAFHALGKANALRYISIEMENTQRPCVVEFKERFISSSEAAAILGLRPFGIQKLIRRGKVPAVKIANRWLIPRAFVEEFAKA